MRRAGRPWIFYLAFVLSQLSLFLRKKCTVNVQPQAKVIALFVKWLIQAHFSSLTKNDFTSLMCHISTQLHEVMSFLHLTLTAWGGQKGQKGQNFKNLANCLKRMENWEKVENSTFKHVFSPFNVFLMFHSGLSQFRAIKFFKSFH